MVAEVRAGLGLLAAVEIDPELRAADPGITERVVAACRERGVLTRGLAGRALQLSPPFVITEPQITRIADTITEALSAVGSAAATR
jgi:adenosylmethionine-8-amino-7-oxononanoate aminotransferase